MGHPGESGHRQLDHTADLALEIWAPDETSLLLEAAQALLGILGADRPTGDLVVREIRLDAVDAEDRLVAWLNEVLFLAMTRGFLVARGELSLGERGQLRGRLHGWRVAPAALRTEIKACTHHGLVLERESGRCRARVVLDV